VDSAFESRLAVTRDGRMNPDRRSQRLRDAFQAVFSLDALADGAATLAANFGAGSSDLTAGGSLEYANLRRFAALGSYPVIVGWDVGSIRYYRDKPKNPLAMQDVRAILELCKSRGIRVILLINPMHADKLEILDLLGYWDAFEDWKRELVALASQYSGNSNRGRFPLWDFSGYDSYSTESVPEERGRVLRWFWDPIHCNRALGDVMLRRIFGAGDSRFGTLLTVDNIELHLAGVREAQRAYRQRHEADARRVRKLFEFATGAPVVEMARVQ
jgi:hypothetical protein